jgi:arylformamidase
MTIHDVSVPIEPGMVIYHDNPGFSIELDSAIAAGATANVSKLTMGAHTGTHIDGPRHFYDGGPGTEALDLAAMIGPCTVVEIPDRGLEPIDRACLEAAAIPEGAERVLLKTTNSALWERSEFTHDFVRLDGSGAEYVLERGIRLIGIDYLSIGDRDAHRALLGAPIVALEGLDLRRIAPGPYDLICLPLRLQGSDGAPSRVVLAERGSILGAQSP